MEGNSSQTGFDESDALLYRALVDSENSLATAFQVDGLSVSGSVTVIFHGRKDLGLVSTYLAHGRLPAGEQIELSQLLRIPCDLDLSTAEDSDRAAELYSEQATAVRDAVIGADAVLSLWREPLAELAGGSLTVGSSAKLALDIPAHSLLPVALVAPERSMAVVAVCASRTLAQGTPPLGIVCAQPDLAQVYAPSDDPTSSIEDFLQAASEYAFSLKERLSRQETTVDRFFSLGG